MLLTRWSLAILLALAASNHALAQSNRVDAIKARGALHCGIPVEPNLGFAFITDDGAAAGFHLDFCRALATALFGRPEAVRFRPIDSARQFLAASEIDIVFHGLNFDVPREAGFAFGPVTFHDGQAVLTRAERATRMGDLVGAAICVANVGPFRNNLTASPFNQQLAWTIRAWSGRDAAQERFLSGECDALSDDASALFAFAAGLGQRFAIMNERLSAQTMTPTLRRGDDQLLAILGAVIDVTIRAEEIGLTPRNIDDPPEAVRADAAELLDPPSTRVNGLASGWERRVIKAVGNYGEIYARNLTSGAILWERGMNELRAKGGAIATSSRR